MKPSSGIRPITESPVRKSISLFLKAAVIFFSVYGTVKCAMDSLNAFMGGTRVFLFFTIQSNIGLAVISLIGACLLLAGRRIPAWWWTVRYVGVISISLTGAVFCFVLAPTMGGKAWTLVNIFTHVIVPIASIADFFLSAIDADIPRSKVLYITFPPLAYVIFAGVGYILNWKFRADANYPYFFLNWDSPAGAFGFTNKLPFMGCVWWILLLLMLILLLGLLYLWILKKIKQGLTGAKEQ